MASSAPALAGILRLNTRLYLNCVADVTDADARRRPNERTNSLIFIACHVLDARHYLARYLGLDEPNPVADVLQDATGIDDVVELPPVERIVDGWRALAPTVSACLDDLGPTELRAPSPQRFPIDDLSIGGGIGFLLQHESYHIGQLALLRKYLGYPAMKYS
jgi:hypothetical protein